MDQENLGRRIREARKARDLSQEALAREAGVSLNLVNKLERGIVTDPHYSTLSGLARALELSVENLVRGGEPVPLGEAPPSPGPAERAALSEEWRLRMLRWIAPTATALNSLFAPKVDTGDFTLEEYEQVGEAFASLDHMEGDAMSYEYIHSEGGGSEAELEASNRVGSYHAGGPMYKLRYTLQRAYETLVRREAAGVPDLEELRRRALRRRAA